MAFKFVEVLKGGLDTAHDILLAAFKLGVGSDPLAVVSDNSLGTPLSVHTVGARQK